MAENKVPFDDLEVKLIRESKIKVTQGTISHWFDYSPRHWQRFESGEARTPLDVQETVVMLAEGKITPEEVYRRFKKENKRPLYRAAS